MVLGEFRNRLALACLFLSLLAGAAQAQLPTLTTTTTETTNLEAIIEQAKKNGVQIIVVDPNTKSPAAGTAEPTGEPFAIRMQRSAYRIRNRFVEILGSLPEFPARAYAAVIAQSPEKAVTWPLVTLAFTAIFLLIGAAARFAFQRWGRDKVLTYFRAEPESEAEKIGFLYSRAILSLLGLAVQLAVAALLVVAFDMGRTYLRSTAMLIIGYWGVVSAYAILIKNLLAVDVPEYRVLRLEDRAAHDMYWNLVGVFALAFLVLGVCFWMDFLGIDRNAHILALTSSSLVASLLLSAIAIRHRRDIATMMFGYRPEFAWSVWQRLFAGLWHVPVVLYFLIAWAVSAHRLLLDKPNALGLVGKPIVYILIALALYGAYLVVADLVFRRSRAKAQNLPAQQEDGAQVQLSDSSAEPTDGTARLRSYKDVAHRAGALLAILFVVASTIQAWGVPLFATTGWANAALDILVVAFLAYITWSAIKVAIDRKLLEEGGPVESVPGEIGGAGATRLSTLLPLFANFLLILIGAVAVMIVLMELGVNITPLFAGAGIVGLAIGFGAQTLVRDILSGVFFLIDDAFRQGEFIEVGAVKGTVEGISLRSMQLRHHLGPLNTIPFGEIKHVTNFSRDWVMMKLPIRLTYDTDAEKVRKLINNFGKELLKDPQIGGDFLQPLKSQGIIQMDESAQIMRVKFMSKPGQQWVMRRKILNGIRDLFQREGIKFAHHEVTVRVAQDGARDDLTDDQKQIAGAAGQRIAQRQTAERQQLQSEEPL
ncbi:MAG: mechanosensitive ion channel family protein [Hyphomicrobiaceae bacterium]